MSEFNGDRQDIAAIDIIDTSSPESFLKTLGQTSRLPKLDSETLVKLREQMSQGQIVEYYSLLNDLADEESGHIEIEPGQIIRPKVLFHASQGGEILEFEPRLEKRRAPNEPAQIFAAPSETVSSMFLVPADDEFTKSGSYDNGRTWTFIIGDIENFRAVDKGGWIYTLPEETFNVDPNKGLGLFEWTSQKPLKPESKKYFPSGLTAMQEMGVRVYVVDKEKFARFNSGEDHKAILATLEPLVNKV